MIQSVVMLLKSIAAAFHMHGREELSEYVDFAADLISQGDKFNDELAVITAKIKEMVEEGRDPSPKEWDEVRAERKRLSQIIRES